MSLVPKKVLFITEGPVDELHLMRSICNDLGLTTSERDFYSYNTDFHHFARVMLPDGADTVDTTIDLLLTLKMYETDAVRLEILNAAYTDIFIIFDFDPHVNTPEFEKISALASFFRDSSDMGRLFINYPMMQSYKHLKWLPDNEYEYRKVNISEVHDYKKLVSLEGLPELIKTHEYNHLQLYEIAYHNYCKREKILGRDYDINRLYKYDGAEDVEILKRQIQDFQKNGQCSVLNTSSLIYLDYIPKKFFNEITRHKDKFRI